MRVRSWMLGLLIVGLATARTARANPAPPPGFFHTCEPELQCPDGGVKCLQVPFHDPVAEACLADAKERGLVERCEQAYRHVYCPPNAPFEAAGSAFSPGTCSVVAQCPIYGFEWPAHPPPDVDASDIQRWDSKGSLPWVSRCNAWPHGRWMQVVCPRSVISIFVARNELLKRVAIGVAALLVGVIAFVWHRRRRAPRAELG